MADAGRKDFSTKINESVTPESQKSTYDKAKEVVTDTYDKAAGKVAPEESKSFSQRLGDSVQRGHDDAKANTKTWGESANEALEHGKQAVSDAAEYVSGVVTGGKEGAHKGGEQVKK
jgi:polyhydroxyalkanoate synthesis regulator phasin